jgi:hypothetical protein
LQVARAVMWAPRVVLWAVYSPFVETSAFVEAHPLGGWAKGILTARAQQAAEGRFTTFSGQVLNFVYVVWCHYWIRSCRSTFRQ